MMTVKSEMSYVTLLEVLEDDNKANEVNDPPK